MKKVTLYHFTTAAHVPRILDDGYLKVVESNVSMKRKHAGPDVVWLTTDEEVPPDWKPFNLPRELVTGDVRQQVRFTVQLPAREVIKWHDWARRWGVDPSWARALVAGLKIRASSWRVIQRPVEAAEWTEIKNISTGEVITHDPDHHHP